MRATVVIVSLLMIGCGTTEPIGPDGLPAPAPVPDRLPRGTRIILVRPAGETKPTRQPEMSVPVETDRPGDKFGFDRVQVGTHAEVVIDETPEEAEGGRQVVIRLTDGPLKGETVRVAPQYVLVE